MNRLEDRTARLAAEGGKGLAPYVTVGDGGLDVTLAVLRALDSAGAVCIELGVPFSDPIADGPIHQAAADRALVAGTTFDDVLRVMSELRTGGRDGAASNVPVAVFSYANPLMRRGWRRACESIAAAGGDALIVPDLPVEESGEMRAAAADHDLCPIFFVTPTTSDDRMAAAASASRGFLYVIGRFGVTGAATEWDEAATGFLARVRAATDLPLAVGFGLGTAGHVAAVARYAEIAIVGSALTDRVHAAVERSPDDAPGAAARSASAFMAELAPGLGAR
jgi:tryptophan synthase alpha chain